MVTTTNKECSFRTLKKTMLVAVIIQGILYKVDTIRHNVSLFYSKEWMFQLEYLHMHPPTKKKMYQLQVSIVKTEIKLLFKNDCSNTFERCGTPTTTITIRTIRTMINAITITTTTTANTLISATGGTALGSWVLPLRLLLCHYNFPLHFCLFLHSSILEDKKCV